MTHIVYERKAHRDSVIDKAVQYWHYRQVFKTHADVDAYRQVRDHPERCKGPVPLGIRGAPQPIECRPGTMDPITLWDAFYVGYHLPLPTMRIGSVILDLGSNAGYTTASLAMHYPQARILAVEIDADNAAICARNVAQFGDRCEVTHAAIWSSSGMVSYAGVDVHDYAIGSTTAAPRSAAAITIDELLDRRSIAEADYMKMDIEGAEATVLQPPISWARRVRNLSLEVHMPATFDWCREVLTAEGFDCTRHAKHPAGMLAVRRR